MMQLINSFVGLGPANLALNICFEEMMSEYRTDSKIFEIKPDFSWHRGMQLPFAKLQISLFKDLVSFRNPKSEFTFVNFLKRLNLLKDFANQSTLYPSRELFSKYLGWVAENFGDITQYNHELIEIEPILKNEGVENLRLHFICNGQPVSFITRNLFLGLGGKPKFPKALKAKSDDVFHSSQILHRTHSLSTLGKHRFIVIGGGQSGGEVALHLLSRFRNASVSVVSKGFLFKRVDDNPFMNTLYDDSYSQYMGALDENEVKRIEYETKMSNYGVVDDEVLQQIEKIRFEDAIRGACRLNLYPYSAISEHNADSKNITFFSTIDKNAIVLEYDYIISATGYEFSHIDKLLKPILPWCEDGKHKVSESYRLTTPPEFRANIYLLNQNYPSYGLAEGTMTGLAERVERIVRDANNLTTAEKVDYAQPVDKGLYPREII